MSIPQANHLILNKAQYAENITRVGTDQTSQTTDIAAKKGPGIRVLLKASMLEAFLDSGACYLPPQCYPATSQVLLHEITSWALGTSSHNERILCVQGLAGAKRSLLARTCAHILASQNKLGAAFFFSRPNEWDDPHYLFPSISCQLATKSELYNDILHHRIQKDPTLITKSITEQFYELLLKPLQHPRTDIASVGEWTMIIDGLDECARHAQCNIIAKSVRERATPFRWKFLGRPKFHIVTSFTGKCVRSVSHLLELPVSRELDYELLHHLTYELRKARKAHHLLVSCSWPSDLVNASAGLCVYAAPSVPFTVDLNSSGPIDELHAALLTAALNEKRIESERSLTDPNSFYTLIMQCIPSKILPVIQKILLLTDCSNSPEGHRMYKPSSKAIEFANILGLSEPQYRKACDFLRLVLDLGPDLDIKFHYPSFMDFLRDPKRSKEFCIYSRLHNFRRELLERLYSHSTIGFPNSSISIDITWPGFQEITKSWVYLCLVQTCFRFCQWKYPLDTSTLTALSNFEFHLIPLLWGSDRCVFSDLELSPEWLRENIPGEFRSRIVRRTCNPVVYMHKPKSVSRRDAYILGCGKNIVACQRLDWGAWQLVPCPTLSKPL